MAKRRRLDVPDGEALAQIARDFAATPPLAPSLGSAAPPIARVAAEAASLAAAEAVEARVKAAAYEADAARWRAAQSEGRVAVRLPLSAIETEHLARDRMVLDQEEMAELGASIRNHGLRMPVEVLRLDGAGGERYGLISGWRRLQALRTLWAETGDERFATVAALVRTPADSAAAYVSMVEENEVRADLSHYERGRIAVVATGQGAFPSVDAAVSVLFASASKAKRSKIRSFAQIHEELGDLLRHGPALSERSGLRLAGALRAGAAGLLRRVLADGGAASAEMEWHAIEQAILEAERNLSGTEALPASGRPRGRGTGPAEQRAIRLGRDLVVERVLGDGWVAIRLRGPKADAALLERLSETVERALRDRAE